MSNDAVVGWLAPLPQEVEAPKLDPRHGQRCANFENCKRTLVTNKIHAGEYCDARACGPRGLAGEITKRRKAEKAAKLAQVARAALQPVPPQRQQPGAAHPQQAWVDGARSRPLPAREEQRQPADAPAAAEALVATRHLEQVVGAYARLLFAETGMASVAVSSLLKELGFEKEEELAPLLAQHGVLVRVAERDGERVREFAME